VSDPANKEIISWNKTGDAFIIFQPSVFIEKILPVYFSHKNLSSFIRQLNMYGFNKTRGKKREQCFTNALFKRGQKNLLLGLKRREKKRDRQIEKKNEAGEEYVKTQDFTKIINRMESNLKAQQNRIDVLEKQNNEFKISVLTLYSELEKSKK